MCVLLLVAQRVGWGRLWKSTRRLGVVGLLYPIGLVLLVVGPAVAVALGSELDTTAVSVTISAACALAASATLRFSRRYETALPMATMALLMGVLIWPILSFVHPGLPA